MRPVTLQIAGLQSYRELQEIDFTQLTDAGVFGIFGPTGSGKSSVLDAITLALYGKVERAPNGTQGIMNQAEQTLAVSFTFELSRPAGTERYRVDRQFKRSGDVGLNQTVSRIVRYTPEGAVVLADKAGDVGKQVQDILGLSMEDFTRAVVLPQGKFAEFLTLTGKERRLMLQRLFGLEAYGDQLSAKVSARLKETEVELKEIDAEQLGLGDASAEALAAASERLADAERAAESERAELAAAEASHDELKQLVALQLEQQAAERQLAELEAREPEVREREAKLALAEQAERLRPYVQRLREARETAAESEARLSAAETEYREAERRAAAVHAEREVAVASLAAQEEPLRARIVQLEQALELEREHARLREEAAKLASAAEQAESELAAARAQLAQELDKKERALRKQAELREELALYAVSVEESRELQEAAAERQALDALAAQGAELEAELTAGTKSGTELEAELLRARSELEAQGEELLRGLAEAGPPERRLAAAEQALEALLREAEAGADAAKREREGAEMHSLAQRLAATLQDGEPCPVCGSPHHPAAAGVTIGAQPGADTGANAQAERDWEDLLQRVRELQLPLRQLAFRWRTAGKQAAELLPEALQGGWQEAASAVAEEPDAGLAHGTPDITAHGTPAVTAHGATAVAAELEELRGWVAAGEKRAASLEALSSRASGHLRSAERRVHELASQFEAACRVLDAQRAKADAAAAALRQREAAWSERYPRLAGRDAAQELEALRAKELKAQELRGRIEKSEPFLRELEAVLEQLRRREAELDKTALQLRTRLQGESQLADAAERQLRERLGAGERAEPLLAGAKAALAALQAAAETAQRAHELAHAALQRAAESRSAALEAREAAGRQLAQAEGAWREALAGAAGFGTEAAVMAALLRAEDRSRWADEVSAYRERERELRARRTQLAERRGGRVVTDDGWAAAQERLRAAKLRREAALETRAKAARDAEQLAAKHARWNELEARRAERRVLDVRLRKLQTVLKGSALVEFLAEEQLLQVSRAASERLGTLTRQRYALEVDSGGGFVIRDDANGGVRRPVTTLSGGETFLTSLSLALALSAQIQLKGEVPLEFFFLDEGFGTLDPELLETVIHALEKLHTDRLAVGVISHVPELRARLPRRLVVHPAEPSGRGSRVSLERL